MAGDEALREQVTSCPLWKRLWPSRFNPRRGHRKAAHCNHPCGGSGAKQFGRTILAHIHSVWLRTARRPDVALFG